MKNILLPFDGSKPAQRALDYVVELREEGLENLVIHLVNVQEEPKLFGDYASQSLVEKLNSEAKRYGETVNTNAIQRLQKAGIECHSHEVIGGIAEAIVKAVGDFGCDTIIMGTRGMSNLANLVMGSVATRVVHEAKVPVLLVK